MLNVALTGNIASGKSAVADYFRELGAVIVDADRIVRDLQRPGTPVFDRIVERFGPGVMAPDGELDRKALRTLVFHDADALDQLNGIVHPAVEEERARQLDAAAQAGARIAVSDIPLLFESGDPSAFDAVVLVDAPEPVRRQRIMDSRGLSHWEAQAMIDAQLPSEAKRARSRFIIENTSDLISLREAAKRVWTSLETLAR
ncbi:MAG: dephospho-CoA kinase [Gemmatimonadota bacterium]